MTRGGKYEVLEGPDNFERYVVVEHPKVCTQGRQLFQGDAKVEFVGCIPDESFDLVLIVDRGESQDASQRIE